MCIMAEKDPHIRVVTLIKMPTPRSPRSSVNFSSIGELNLNAESGSHQSYISLQKGKSREERLDLSPVAVGVTELKVILEEDEGKGDKNSNGKS